MPALTELQKALALVAASKEKAVPTLKLEHASLTKKLREIEAELLLYGETPDSTLKQGRQATTVEYTDVQKEAVKNIINSTSSSSIDNQTFCRAIDEFNANRAKKIRNAMEADGFITVSQRAPGSGAIATTIKLA